MPTKEASLSVDEVHALAEAVAAAGGTPSGRTLVRAAHQRGLKLSKRVALLRLEALAAAGVTFAPAVPPPPRAPVASPPVPVVDPVQAAAQRKQEAAARCKEALAALLAAKTTLIATRNVLIDGVLHGTIPPTDPIHREALRAVAEHKRRYDAADADYEQACVHLAQMQQLAKRQEQEQWVAHYRPEVAANVARWKAKKDLPDLSRWEKADAVQQYGFAQLAYNEAMQEALTAVNGTGH
jgi:hypothetical protein